MTDVFISYERGSEVTALRVAEILRQRGRDVWLDADLPPNRAYTNVIREHLMAAKAVVVLWSEAGAESEWVRAEADEGRQARKLVQATLDGSLPPLPFNQIHCADLKGWNGDPHAPALAKVVSAVDSLIGAAPIERPETPTQPKVPRVGRPALLIALTGAILVVTIVAFWFGRGLPWATSPPSSRLAILPFRVESTQPSAKFFADGLNEEIQSALDDNRFQVVSRSDAEALAGPDAGQKIDQLGVRLLFDGAVQDDGETTTVTVNLNDPRSHVSVWSSRVDGDTAKAPILRVHLAALIVTVLKCADRSLNPVDGLSDPQVLSQYLVACDLFARSGEDHPQTVDEMLSALRQVTARAPGFPPAHSALAKYLAYDAAVIPPDQAAAYRREAKTEADRALALDPKDADAYVALELLQPAGNWAQREGLLRQGLSADPDWSHANGFLGSVLAETGRVQEALGYYQKAMEEDRPGQNWPAGAVILAATGHTADADAATSEMQKFWPNSPDVWFPRIQVRVLEGRWDDALAILREPVAAQVASPSDLATSQAYFVASKSPTPALREAAHQKILQYAAQGGYHLSIAISMLAALGYLDDAFRLAANYQPGLALTGADSAFLFMPQTAAMRRDPRFMALADRLGLVTFWRSTGRWPDFCREPGLPYNCSADPAMVGRDPPSNDPKPAVRART